MVFLSTPGVNKSFNNEMYASSMYKGGALETC